MNRLVSLTVNNLVPRSNNLRGYTRAAPAIEPALLGQPQSICGALMPYYITLHYIRDVTRPQPHEAEAEAEATTHEAEAEAEATTHEAEAEAEATTHEAEAEAEAEAKTHL